MNNTKPLMAGSWEMSIGDVLIPAEMLGEISPNYEEGVIEAETQVGKITQPSGKADTAELTFTLYIPNLDFLKKIFDYLDTDALIFGGGSCAMKTPKPINIHLICNGKDAKDDLHIYAGVVKTAFNPTLSAGGDPMAVECTISMQPVNGNYMLLGYPNPPQKQYWDVAEQKWVNVEGESKPASNSGSTSTTKPVSDGKSTTTSKPKATP